MSVDQPVPALFLHIQKTAGTAIVNSARQMYGERMTSHGDCWGRQPAELADLPFVSGHIGYDYARHLMHDRYSFVFLRDPVERILSLYYFCRERNPEEFMIYRKAVELDVESFLLAGRSDPWVRKNIWNNQVWQLAHGYAHLDNRRIDDFAPEQLLDLAVSHLDAFSFVGFTETFDRDAEIVLDALDMPALAAGEQVNATVGRPIRADMSATALEYLDELTRLDRILYAEARSRRA